MMTNKSESPLFCGKRDIRAGPVGGAMKFSWKSEKPDTALSAENRAERVQFTCLLAVVLMELAFFALEDRAGGIAYLVVERYLTLPAMAFLGASFCRELPRRSRWHLYAGLAMAALFFLNQILHQVLEAEAKEIGTFVCAYALCFPFAAATEDARRQRGLKWMAGLFLGVGLLLTGYTGLLLANAVPECLKAYVKWDGARLYAMGHPNICATLLMISMALSAGLALKSRRLWVRVLLAVLLIPQFAALSLTNGRTTIILTCLLMGGIAFCALLQGGQEAQRLAAVEPVAPWRILAITFTNKAAGELKERLERMLGPEATSFRPDFATISAATAVLATADTFTPGSLLKNPAHWLMACSWE